MTRRLATLALLAVSAALPAAAQAPNPVSGVTVVAGPGPIVQATYPADGAAAPGGVLILKIVFNQPMAPDAWAYSRSAAGDFPECLADPRLLADQRTYVLLCQVAPSHAYAIEINETPRFVSADGRHAQSYTLKFTTQQQVTRGLHDALTQAGLTDVDDPIMTWRDPGKGVSQTAAAP